ncbi:hypothetical protein HPB50_023143 [Hyalomma asiaticum]|uniref:Uncharacterized protein n=1 Tax=Hyalomma asiaticum TaxID=266040 RepID=A0ACB7TA61_HYAAI|nr:hypothetical protein HPB50_023143 [Hyalomma asiaticum]
MLPEKSGLLVRLGRTRGRPPLETPDPKLTLNGVRIPTVSTLRVLGLTLQKDGAGMATINQLKKTVSQLVQLIERVYSAPQDLRNKTRLEPCRPWLPACRENRATVLHQIVVNPLPSPGQRPSLLPRCPSALQRPVTAWSLQRPVSKRDYMGTFMSLGTTIGHVKCSFNLSTENAVLK